MGKKILLINKMYSPDIGGVETVVKQYAHFLSYENEVTVLTASKKATLFTKNEKDCDINIIRCSSLGTFFSMPLSFVLIPYFFKIRHKFDIVHFHEPFPLGSLIGFFRKHKKNKYIVTWHSDIIKQKLLKKSVEYFQDKLLKKSDIITITSKNLLDYSSVVSKYKDKVKILPLSINTENLEYTKPNFFIPDKYYLSLGRLSYYKGIKVLIEAYEQTNSTIPLLIIGRGGEEKFVREHMKSNSKIIFINEFITENEKNWLLKNAECFIFPSIYPSEAFGIIQLEAMINKTPIINTNLKTGVPWVSLNRITGLTVEPNDVKQLKKAIMEIVSDDNKLEEYSSNAEERVRKYFSDNIIKRDLKEIYNLLK